MQKLLSFNVSNGIRMALILLDREFFSSDVINGLKQLGQTFLMPAVKNPRIKTAIREYASGKRPQISRHTMGSKDRKASFTLVIVQAPKAMVKKAKTLEDKYLAFATNIPKSKIRPRRITKMYRDRWGIETGYRNFGQLKPYTVSPSNSARMVMFYFSMLYYNTWVLSNALRDGNTRTVEWSPTIEIQMLKSFVIKFVEELIRERWRLRHPDPGG